MTERMGLVTAGRQNGRSAALARRAELRPAARRLAAVAVGFAGGWAVLYGALMPFGLGFVLGFAEECFAPCAAGAALGMLLHGFGALSLRSVCMLCALGAAVAARWMGARTLTPAALAGCGTLVGVALFLTYLAQTGLRMTALRATYPAYYASKNKIALTPAIDVDKVLREIKDRYAGEQVNDIDGVKIDFAENWVHLRKSNTEPIIRIYTEARSMAEADALAQRFIGELREICNL